MRYLLLFMLLVGGGGWFVLQWRFEIEPVPPNVFTVSYANEPRGYAIGLDDRFGVMPKHLWSENLRVGRIVPESVISDSRKDLLIFRSNFVLNKNTVSTEKSMPGDFFYVWYDAENYEKVWLKDTNQTIPFRGQSIEGVWVVSGLVEPGDSGRPLVDADGRAWGIIIGGNKDKKLIYAQPLSNAIALWAQR